MQLMTDTVSQLRAVLTGALTLSDGTVYNTATELNDFVYNTIAGWCAPCGSMQGPHLAPCVILSALPRIQSLVADQSADSACKPQVQRRCHERHAAAAGIVSRRWCGRRRVGPGHLVSRKQVPCSPACAALRPAAASPAIGHR